MARLIVGLISGLLFGLGLMLSGMTQPGRVIGFLTPFHGWMPELALVMGGAIAVHLLSLKLIFRRKAPILDTGFHLPTKTSWDKNLVIGSVLFGIGWGLAGYCPGPALCSAFALKPQALIFLMGLVLGVGIFLVSRKEAKP
jgi:uncharacterized membrane protein YedE/YeeE